MKTDILDVLTRQSFWTSPLVIVSLSSAFLLIFVLTKLLKIKKTIETEERIAPFVVKTGVTKPIYANIIISTYLIFINQLNILLIKTRLFSNLIEKNKKYLKITNLYTKEVSFVSEKIFIIMIALFAKAVSNLPFLNLFFLVILTYIAIEVVRYLRYNKYIKDLNTEFERAITLMNNSFKSGSSVLQAIDYVNNNIEGPLQVDFKRISDEVSLGLSIEEAVIRFSKRVDIKEAEYLGVTLGFLSKSGGKVSELFNAIENRIYNKKELSLEYKSVTGGLKLISAVLLSIPLIIVIGLYVLDPVYFQPLIDNFIGRIILLIIINLYFIYYITIKKIFSVRM